MNMVLGIALDIRPRHLRRYRIVVACENHSRTKQPRSDGEDSRACSDVEYNVVGLNPSGERFHRHLGCFMCPGAERLSWIYMDRKTIVRTNGILPAWNDEEIITDRKACVRLLPFLRPVAFLDKRTGNGGTRFFSALEYSTYDALNFLKT